MAKIHYLTEEGLKYIKELLDKERRKLEDCDASDLKNIQNKIVLYKDLIEGYYEE